MEIKQIIPVAVPTYAVWTEEHEKTFAYGVCEVHYLALVNGEDDDYIIPLINNLDGFYDFDASAYDVFEGDNYYRWKKTVADLPVIEYFGKQPFSNEEVAKKILGWDKP